ncbi:MAG: hypothetical protein ACXVCY_12580 [Pseudobdellovibrionaceae bacterium]
MSIFIASLFLIFHAHGAQTSSSKPGILMSENSQESDSENEKTKNFTAKVRIIREDTDGMEIFFEGDKAKGAYSLPQSVEHYAKKIKDLEESKKPTGPSVSVTVDSEKRIKKVEIQKSSGTNINGFKAPSDPNQKWDFGKIPENL